MEGVGIVEGINGMSVPVFLSFHLPSSQRHTMPYRGGGHSTAAAISALGGESNYVDGPRRRRPPPVSLLPLSSHPPRPPGQPKPVAIHPPLLRSAPCIQQPMFLPYRDPLPNLFPRVLLQVEYIGWLDTHGRVSFDSDLI